jgi:hypothetical protein
VRWDGLVASTDEPWAAEGLRVKGMRSTGEKGVGMLGLQKVLAHELRPSHRSDEGEDNRESPRNEAKWMLV